MWRDYVSVFALQKHLDFFQNWDILSATIYNDRANFRQIQQ